MNRRCQKCPQKTNVLYYIVHYQKWCCEECYDEYNSTIDKNCIQCGKKLKGNRVKFCSDNCQKKYADKTRNRL